MSFYGSVYYQLIDTFYKAVLRNKGKNKNTFVDTETIPDEFEAQAVGRKGVFGFDAGNKWINLNVVSEEKPNSNELYSIYEIYHGAPDATVNNQANGFKVLLDEKTLNERIDENGIIQLNYLDEFETTENKYDEAGHISTSEKKTYRLPMAEVNDKVIRLEELVGSPKEGRNDTDTGEETGTPLETLYDYVEDGYDDIKKLESYVGDWSQVTSLWHIGGKYAPTIAETIGNLDSMYDSTIDRYENHKTFSDIVGKLKPMYEAVNENNPISLTSAISKIQQNLVVTSRQIQDNIDGISAKIGKPLDAEVDIYQHIESHYDSIENIEDILDWTEKTKTVSQEIDGLDGRIDSLEIYRNSLETTVFPAITQNLSTLNQQTAEHYQIWSKASEEFEKTHEDIYAKMGTVPENKNIISIIEDLEDNISTTIGNVPENGNIMNEIINREQAIYDLIGEFDENSTIKGTIDTLEENITDLIGEVPTDSTVMGIVSNNHSQILDLIGGIPEESNVSAELEELQDQIDDIVADLGTNSSETETAFSLIAANTQEIADINTNLGEIGNITVAEQFTEIHNLLGDQIDGKSLSARITETKESLNNYVTKNDLTAANYATNSDLESIQNAVIEIAGDLTNIVNLKENIVTENTNLLQDIFDRLVILEANVKSIQETLNSSSENPSEPEEPGTDVTDPNPEENIE